MDLRDEPHVEVWRDYAARVARSGTIATLAAFIPQLRFAIRPGMKRDATYRRVVRHGEFRSDDVAGMGFHLNQPGSIAVRIHRTIAGAVPVIAVSNRDDFASLVCALANGNEPRRLPQALGACAISNFTNWHRVHLWCHANVGAADDGSADERSARLRRALRDRAISKDRFFLLSDGPYSGVAATDMELGDEAWREISLRLRLEHESAHYITQRIVGPTFNPLVDEIAADWAAITAVAGRYRADWFLRFMGVQDESTTGAGGRLEHYCDRRIMSEAEVQRARSAVRQAALMLEAFTDGRLHLCADARSRGRMMLAIESLRLEELASAAAVQHLEAALARSTVVPMRMEGE